MITSVIESFQLTYFNYFYVYSIMGINITTFALFMNFKTSLTIFNIKQFFFLKHTVSNILIFSIKFIILIALLVFIRGGIPRYRYDFLTKIGWIKFLSLILTIFLMSLLLTLVI